MVQATSFFLVNVYSLALTDTTVAQQTIPANFANRHAKLALVLFPLTVSLVFQAHSLNQALVSPPAPLSFSVTTPSTNANSAIQTAIPARVLSKINVLLACKVVSSIL